MNEDILVRRHTQQARKVCIGGGRIMEWGRVAKSGGEWRGEGGGEGGRVGFSTN